MRDKPGICKIELHPIKQFVIKYLHVSLEKGKASEFQFSRVRLKEEHGLRSGP